MVVFSWIFSWLFSRDTVNGIGEKEPKDKQVLPLMCQELRKLFNGRPEEAADVLCGLKASAGNAPDQKAHRMFDKDRQCCT